MTILPSFVRKGQQEPYWCWAACIEMVLTYLRGESPEQCTIAGLGQFNDGTVLCCGQNLDKSACGRSNLDVPLQRAGVDHKCLTPDEVEFGTIKAEIDAGRPVLCDIELVEPSPPGTHALVITGYDEAGQRLLGQNPEPVGSTGSTCWLSFNCLKANLNQAYVHLALLQPRPQAAAPLRPPTPIPLAPSPPDSALLVARSLLPEALRLAGARADLALTNGTPIGVFDLPLSRVLDGTLPSLLTELAKIDGPSTRLNRVLFPVVAPGRLISVIEVVSSQDHPDDPTWDGCCIGDTVTFTMIDEVRRFDAITHRVGLGGYVAFTVPALGIWLLATIAAGTPVFLPTINVPRTDLLARKRYHADRIGAALRAVATLR